jgi:hypothetical protein
VQNGSRPRPKAMRCGQTQHDDNRTLYSCLINYPLDCASSSCLVVTSRIGSSTASLLARATSSISPRKPAVGYEAYFNTFWRLQSRTSGPRQAGAIRRFLCQQALPSQELPTFCQSSLEICLTSPLTFPLSDLWAPTRDVILSATNYSQKAFNPHPNDDPCVIIEHELNTARSSQAVLSRRKIYLTYGENCCAKAKIRACERCAVQDLREARSRLFLTRNPLASDRAIRSGGMDNCRALSQSDIDPACPSLTAEKLVSHSGA